MLHGVADPFGEHVLHYIPGEICLVVQDGAGEHPDARYERVSRVMNEQLQTFFARDRDAVIRDLFKQNGLTPEHDNLVEDLLPEEVWEELRAHLTGWQLTRLDGKRLPDELPPWVALSADKATILVCFYQLGTVPRSADATRTWALREDRHVPLLVHLINLVNGGYRQGRAPWHPGADERITATPHWLTSATGEGLVEGSPGGKPEPIDDEQAWRAGYWSFREAYAQLKQPDAGESARVTVAILDTSPPQAQVAAKAASCAQNELLQKVSTIAFDQVIAGTYLDGYVPDWHDAHQALEPLENLAMPDHGLFVAGIVRDLAPEVEIRLLRVLNDYGSGDLLALLSALARLLDEFSTSDDRRLVINLSLGVAIPPGEHHLRLMLPATYREVQRRLRASDAADLDTALATLERTDIGTILAVLHGSLARVIERLSHRENVLVVAAAGNDNQVYTGSLLSERGPRRPEPRWPARYDGVLGVAAIKARDAGHAWQPSDFSNRGDVVIIENGIATFGGNANAAKVIPTSGPVIDAIRGVFSAGHFPHSGHSNRTGWAYWAGTSFAAPIISGIAANFWASNRAIPPDALRGVIRDLAPHAGIGLDLDTQLDAPVVPMSQAFVP